MGELLAHLRRVHEKERVAPHGGGPGLQHGGGDGIPDAVAVEVPAQALLRVDGLYVVVYRTDDGRQFRVP